MIEWLRLVEKAVRIPGVRLRGTGAESWLWYLPLAAHCQLNSVTPAPYVAVLRTDIFLPYENPNFISGGTGNTHGWSGRVL